MNNTFWQEYPDNTPEPERLNGPCMLHGRFDCADCCPELSCDEEPYDEDDTPTVEMRRTG